MGKKSLEYFDAHFNGKSPSTKRIYTLWLQRFFEYHGTTAEEFYSEAKAVKDGVLNGTVDERDIHFVEGKVNEFVEHLRKPGNNYRKKAYAENTINHCVKAVNAYAQKNKLLLDLSEVSKLSTKTYGKSLARPEQIRRVLTLSAGKRFEHRNNSIVLALKDSGIRESDLAVLMVEDYQRARENAVEMGYSDFAVFKLMESVKTGAHMAIHMGPEATNSIDDYLGSRETGPLFPRRELDGVGGYMVGDEALSAGGLSMLLSRLCREWGDVSGHSLRKFNETKLAGAGVQSQLLALLHGVSTGRDSYLKNYEDGSLTRAYIGAYDELRLFGVGAGLAAQEEMQTQIEALQSQLAAITKYMETFGDPEELRLAVELGRVEKLDSQGVDVEELEKRVRSIRESEKK